MGRSVTDPVALTADEFQAVAKSVRRQVQKLNKAGVGDAGQAYQAALARGDYRAAGTIAHNRMFSRLGSRPLQTTSGSPIQINRWLEPPPGATSSFGYNYRIPDLQYGVPRTPGYRVWDFKARQPSPTFSDPTGQFADIKAWTGVDPTPLYYWW